MNTITLNDWLKRGLVAAKWQSGEIEKMLHSPCLTLTDFNEPITDADAQAIKLIGDDDVIRTPFPMFRYWMQAKGNVLFGCGKREKGRLFLISFHKKDGGIGPACWCADYLGGNPFGGKATYENSQAFSTRDFRDVTRKYLLRDVPEPDATRQTDWPIDEAELERMPEQGKRDLAAKLKRDLHESQARVTALGDNLFAMNSTLDFMNGVLRPSAEGLGGLIPTDSCPEFVWLALHGCVMRACYEYLAPYNFMALVRPNKEGKSVEWMTAREHYTVIHRYHPANNEAIAEGAAVAAESDDVTIKRTAHSRRAHTRLLSSAKFRFKQGQRVFVRACWCGPKEWKDEGGKQIYRILVEQHGLEIAA